MKKIQILTLLVALSSFAFAQTPLNLTGGSTATNFDGGSLDNGTGSLLNTFPTGWGLEELGSNANSFYRAGTGSSNAGDARSFGMASSQERAFGGVASGSVEAMLGFAFRNGTGNTILSMNVSYTGEQWRAGDTNPLVDSLLFEYSLDADSIGDMSATWVAVSALDFLSPNPTGGTSAGALDGNLTANKTNMNATITVTVPNGDTVRFRWRDINLSGSDDGLSVDDFSMTVTTSGGPLPPALLSTMPADNASNVPVSTSSLSITLDQTISSLGSGNVRLTDLTNMTSVNITNITTSGATATFNGVTLSSNTDYAVQIDSGLLLTATSAFGGIGDSTTWNFKTENTTPPPAITNLNETFTGCMDPVFGVFKAYSEVGGQDWRCTTFGHNDTNAVRMNGFAGGPQDNLDWLVSPPLDFSAMTAPNLHFWSKLRFPAGTVKELLVSTNYTGIGNPSAASWSAVQINNWTALDTNWRAFNNTDLTNYKSSNFHIAFRYASDTVDADEWSLDDIMVTDGPLSLSTFDSKDLSFKVLGTVTSTLTLQSIAANEKSLSYALHDMAGRIVSKGDLNVVSGKQLHQLNTASINSGMYILHITDGSARTALKFVVR